MSGRSKWDLLDSLVHRLFKEYVMRVDPASNLGLSSDSLSCYEVGEVTRTRDSPNPEFLPYGYLVGDFTTIRVHLLRCDDEGGEDHVDALAFDTLTPKPVVHRYVSLLTEHRRVVLAGPPGTGKTSMAKRLAEFLVGRERPRRRNNMGDSATTPTNEDDGPEFPPLPGDAVVTFKAERRKPSALVDFMSDLVKKTDKTRVPKVVILDNLHLVGGGKLEEAFDKTLSGVSSADAPYIIGTIDQTSTSPSSASSSDSTTTALQLRHGFRWVLCPANAEPARGMLGRQLRRKMLAVEARRRVYDGEAASVMEWVARLHSRINR